MHQPLIILDFGSQYTQLIARRVREKKVYCRILPFNAKFEEIESINPMGIILSGSPANVTDKKAPIPDLRIFDLGVPILGICFGLQIIAHLFKGRVHKSAKREYGKAELTVKDSAKLFSKLPKKLVCWMSHGDKLDKLPSGFKSIARTSNSPVAAIANMKKKIYGVQFHPEVVHTQLGDRIIENFLFRICAFKGDWTATSFIKETIQQVKAKVGKDRVVLGLSGGVDSSVAALLLHKALGKQLTCIFVDNGLLRLGEAKAIETTFRKKFKMNLKFVDASKEFLTALKGVTSPERKRKIIGKVFIDVFDREAKKIGKVKFLAQGTLYPDVIESVSFHGGPSVTIKSHHNVGGLPKKMKLKLVEPLRELFKDEVRKVGKSMGLAKDLIGRHPFPGPGLAVRVLGAVSKERCDMLREADAIAIEELHKAKIYNDIWQAFTVLLPVKSVGVMGDGRTYENAVAFRAVTSLDGMTADWARVPYDVLAKISNRIINEVRGINRVCYDISSKPPATIEWE